MRKPWSTATILTGLEFDGCPLVRRIKQSRDILFNTARAHRQGVFSGSGDSPRLGLRVRAGQS